MTKNKCTYRRDFEYSYKVIAVEDNCPTLVILDTNNIIEAIFYHEKMEKLETIDDDRCIDYFIIVTYKELVVKSD